MPFCRNLSSGEEKKGVGSRVPSELTLGPTPIMKTQQAPNVRDRASEVPSEGAYRGVGRGSALPPPRVSRRVKRIGKGSLRGV